MSPYLKRRFIFVSCCRPLARVLIGTETMCPVCNKWVIAGKDTELKRKPLPAG